MATGPESSKTLESLIERNEILQEREDAQIENAMKSLYEQFSKEDEDIDLEDSPVDEPDMEDEDLVDVEDTEDLDGDGLPIDTPEDEDIDDMEGELGDEEDLEGEELDGEEMDFDVDLDDEMEDDDEDHETKSKGYEDIMEVYDYTNLSDDELLEHVDEILSDKENIIEAVADDYDEDQAMQGVEDDFEADHEDNEEFEDDFDMDEMDEMMREMMGSVDEKEDCDECGMSEEEDLDMKELDEMMKKYKQESMHEGEDEDCEDDEEEDEEHGEMDEVGRSFAEQRKQTLKRKSDKKTHLPRPAIQENEVAKIVKNSKLLIEQNLKLKEELKKKDLVVEKAISQITESTMKRQAMDYITTINEGFVVDNSEKEQIVEAFDKCQTLEDIDRMYNAVKTALKGKEKSQESLIESANSPKKGGRKGTSSFQSGEMKKAMAKEKVAYEKPLNENWNRARELMYDKKNS